MAQPDCSCATSGNRERGLSVLSASGSLSIRRQVLINIFRFFNLCVCRIFLACFLFIDQVFEGACVRWAQLYTTVPWNVLSLRTRSRSSWRHELRYYLHPHPTYPPSFIPSHLTSPTYAFVFDQDLGLEFDESETYDAFVDFFDDVTPEFAKFGRVTRLAVCGNYEPHLRGTVYVQYER